MSDSTSERMMYCGSVGDLKIPAKHVQEQECPQQYFASFTCKDDYEFICPNAYNFPILCSNYKSKHTCWNNLKDIEQLKQKKAAQDKRAIRLKEKAKELGFYELPENSIIDAKDYQLPQDHEFHASCNRCPANMTGGRLIFIDGFDCKDAVFGGTAWCPQDAKKCWGRLLVALSQKTI